MNDHPPTHPVSWNARHAITQTRCVVQSQTWYAARAEAARKLGVPPEELDVTMEDT